MAALSSNPNASLAEVVAAAGTGALSGALAGLLPGGSLLAGAISGAIGAAAGDVAGQYAGAKVCGRDFDWNWKQTAAQSALGFASGGLGGGSSNLIRNTLGPLGAKNLAAGVAAGLAGMAQLYSNLAVPASPYGGFAQ